MVQARFVETHCAESSEKLAPDTVRKLSDTQTDTR